MLRKRIPQQPSAMLLPETRLSWAQSARLGTAHTGAGPEAEAGGQ